MVVASLSANPLEQSVFATSVPPEVAEPTGRGSYAPIEEIGKPYHDKDVGGHDIESIPSADREDDVDFPRPSEEEKSTPCRRQDPSDFLCSLCG
jgi:hypothetical protein